MEREKNEFLDPLKENEELRSRINDLYEERDLIKHRVRAQIRKLVFENDDLRRELEDTKAQLRRALSLPRAESQKSLSFAQERRYSEDVERRSSVGGEMEIGVSPGLKRTVSEATLATANSPAASPQGMPRKTSGENNTAKKGTWKDKMKYIKRKTTLMTTAHKDEKEEDEEGIEPNEVHFDASGGLESDLGEHHKVMDEKPTEEPKAKEFEFVEEDQPDLVFVKQEGSQKMPLVKAGTTERLIDRLLPEKYPDPDYLSHLLLTYRSFTTPEKILDTLADKFNTQPPEGATPEEVEDFNKNRLTPIRLRITNVLKTWLSKKHSYDLEDEEMVPKIQSVIQIIEDSGLTAQANLLKHSLQKLREDKRRVVPSTVSAPRPVFSPPLHVNSLIGLTLTDIDPLETARQITLKEFELFQAISPKECLNQSWSKSAKETLAPNILKMIHWSNDVSGWVMSELLARESPKHRAEIIKLFLRIAKHCRDLNNYNAIFEILAGLQAAPIYRLSKTWEKVEKGTKQLHKELQAITSREKNFHELRGILKKSLPPCIPYLGMFLTDLTFIDTGHPDRTSKSEQFPDGLINFIKLRQTAQVIKQIQLFQQTQPNLEYVPAIQEYFATIAQCNISEAEAFKRSLIVEPREPQQ